MSDNEIGQILNIQYGKQQEKDEIVDPKRLSARTLGRYAIFVRNKLSESAPALVSSQNTQNL